jgi:hypothetical protein
MLVPAGGSRCAREGASSAVEPARGRRGPSSEAEPARGSVSPRARRTCSREREPSSEADLARGGALLGRSGEPRGPSWRGMCCVRTFCVMFEECLCFVFLQVLSRIPPVFQRTLVAVPDSSPRASVCVPVRFPQMLEPTGRAFFPPGRKCLSVGPRQQTRGSSP